MRALSAMVCCLESLLSRTSALHAGAVVLAALSVYLLISLFAVLHPRHKLSYFKKMKWRHDWITNAHNMIRTEYDKRYANRIPRVRQDSGLDKSSTEDAPVNEKVCRWHARIQFISNTGHHSQPDMNIFEALEHEDITDDEVSDELTRYLSTDPERVKDALEWWNDRCASFPNLSRMALDYLSIPGMSGV